MKSLFKALSFVILPALLLSCSGSGSRSGGSNEDGEEKIDQDILTGSLTLAVDESVHALLEEQLEVFRSSYTNSRIQILALPERLAINALLKGEASVGVLARTLTDEENAAFKQRAISPRVFPIAYDAVVLLANGERTDSTIHVSDVQKIMSAAEGGALERLVFTSINSAPFRYLKEFVGAERVSAAGVTEVGGLEELFAEVAKNRASIGVISLNQFLAHKHRFEFFNNLRILGVRDDLNSVTKDTIFYKPSQSTLADGSYPFKQTIYVLNYQPNMGLGVGLSAFLTGDRGQRIVLKAGLLPATMPGREIIIRDNINY